MTAEPMLRYSWWWLRRRFWVALIFVVVHAAAVAFVFSQYRDAPSDFEIAPEESAQVERTLGGSYRQYLRETWAGGDLGAVLAVIGVALAVGGAAAERRQGTGELTLSLPVPRSHWLIAQSGLVVLLLVGLALVSATVIAVGGWTAGVGVAPRDMALAVVSGTVGSVYAVTLAIAATTWTRDALGAAIIAVAVLFVLGGSGDGMAWHPGRLIDVQSWETGVTGLPWRALLTAMALTGGFLLIAIRRFDNVDL